MLKESEWDYWDLYKSNALWKKSNQIKFYSTLRNYLKSHGPLFEEEILENINRFIPSYEDSDSMGSYFIREFGEKALNQKRLHLYDVKIRQFGDMITKYISDKHDTYRIIKEDRYGSFVHMPLSMENILYTSNSSLRSFLLKDCQSRMKRLLNLEILPLSKREPRHTKRKSST